MFNKEEFAARQEENRKNAELDLSKYKTKAGGAKALYRFLKAKAVELGLPATSVFICSPAENEARGYGSSWSVSWEEGPYEWAIGVSGGSSMYGPERGYGPDTPKPEIYAFNDNWYVEPWYSFDLFFSE